MPSSELRGFDVDNTDIGAPCSGEHRRVLSPGDRVAVLGGGCCGVFVCKALAEQGLLPTVFEQSDGIGGVWRDTGVGGVAYRVLRTNSSVVSTTAADFPYPFKTSSLFPHYTEILKYLDLYADHFNLKRFFRFNVKVVSVTPTSSPPFPRWRVVTDRGDEEEFDAVFSCTGQYGGGPVWPSLPGRERFVGDILHSSAYRTNNIFEGKNVVIVGLGNSALDIALDACHVAKNVVISARTGSAILEIEKNGVPIDTYLLTRIGGAKGPGVGSKVLQAPLHQAFLRAGMVPPPDDPSKLYIGMVKDAKSTLHFIENGRLSLGPGIAELREREVVLTDGRAVPADVIVCCTGYDLPKTLSYLPAAGDTVRYTPRGKPYFSLYKQCLHPSYHNLVLCGLATSNANEALIGEMQARWVSAMLLGKARWPTKPDITAYLERRDQQVRETDPTYPRFIRFVPYMDGLAAEIGAHPNLPPVPKGWSLAKPEKDAYLYNLWFGPVTPTHYRLNGPHKWDEAKARAYVTTALIPGPHYPKTKGSNWSPPSKL